MAIDAKNNLRAAGKPINSKDVPFTNPLGILSVYANEFGVGFTVTDARLIFAEVGADITSNTATKVLKANVVIPLQGAEALARQILAGIEQHKKNLEALRHGEQPAKS
jgi:hypothetical protein